MNIININEFEIKKLKDYESGHDGTYFKIIDYKAVDIVSYPSIKNGKQLLYYDKDYLKYKTKVFKKGYALVINGNAVCCETDLIDRGFKAFAVSPNRVEVIIYEGDEINE